MHLCHVVLDTTTPDARFSPTLAVLDGESVAPVTNPADPEARVDIFTTPLDNLREWCTLAEQYGGRISLHELEAAPAPPRLIWAAGVTYKRSQEARMEESSQKDVYDKVYDAPRPELFLKCATIASSSDEPITIRSDSTWNVPEPELTLVINSHQEIVAFTVGNDVSSRSIEGENPLYLPQAKMWHGSSSVSNTFLLNTEDIDAKNLDIDLTITRDSAIVFQDDTNTSQMKRSYEDLVDWLHRGQEFPLGVYLMTGTGIVPPDDFTLQAGDKVIITIPQVGQLINPVAMLDVETNELRTR